MKDALETLIGNKITADHPVSSWLVEFAAVLVNRYEVGHDGNTPYERLRGKQSRRLGLEFGELLHFRRHRAAGKQAKLDVSWEDGVFLGYRTLSRETIVGTLKGVMRTMRIRGWLLECRGNQHQATTMLRTRCRAWTGVWEDCWVQGLSREDARGCPRDPLRYMSCADAERDAGDREAQGPGGK